QRQCRWRQARTDSSMMLVLSSSFRSVVPSPVVKTMVKRDNVFVLLSRLREYSLSFARPGPSTDAPLYFASRRVSMSPRAKKKSSSSPSVVPFHNSNTAGIDIGATELYVAVPCDRSSTPVRCFNSFTQDLIALAECL